MPRLPASGHDLQPGGKVSYFMTGPEGEQHHGWWKVVAVDEPHRLDLEDGFADTDGNPDDALPTMQFTVTFVEMGMEEGLTAAMSQIDAILTAG